VLYGVQTARELKIGGLRTATTYIARVQALDVTGAAGHSTSILFTTPLLQTDADSGTALPAPLTTNVTSDHNNLAERAASAPHARLYNCTHFCAHSDVILLYAKPALSYPFPWGWLIFPIHI